MSLSLIIYFIGWFFCPSLLFVFVAAILYVFVCWFTCYGLSIYHFIWLLFYIVCPSFSSCYYIVNVFKIYFIVMWLSLSWFSLFICASGQGQCALPFLYQTAIVPWQCQGSDRPPRTRGEMWLRIDNIEDEEASPESARYLHGVSFHAYSAFNRYSALSNSAYNLIREYASPTRC